MFAPCGFPLWKGHTMTKIAKVQKALDTINEACQQNPDNSRLRERQLHLQGLLEALAG